MFFAKGISNVDELETPKSNEFVVVTEVPFVNAQKSINWTIFIQLIRPHLKYDCDYKN